VSQSNCHRLRFYCGSDFGLLLLRWDHGLRFHCGSVPLEGGEGRARRDCATATPSAGGGPVRGAPAPRRVARHAAPPRQPRDARGRSGGPHGATTAPCARAAQRSASPRGGGAGKCPRAPPAPHVAAHEAALGSSCTRLCTASCSFKRVHSVPAAGRWRRATSRPNGIVLSIFLSFSSQLLSLFATQCFSPLRGSPPCSTVFLAAPTTQPLL